MNIMARFLFADASYLFRGIFAVAGLALVLGLLFQSQFSVETQAQEPLKAAPINAFAAKAAASSASEVFLSSQTRSDRRLLQSGWSNIKPKWIPRASLGFGRSWISIEPSTSKRLYVFDTVEKKR